jgi:signal peptidase I
MALCIPTPPPSATPPTWPLTAAGGPRTRLLLWQLLKPTLLVGVPAAIAFHDRVASVAVVEGRSMQPTLNPPIPNTAVPTRRDWILVDHATARRGRLQRGDVVVLRSPKDRSVAMVKRLVALPHDVVM